MKHPSQISISDFTYDLPNEKIAVYPLEKRDESKLLVFKNQQIEESRFKNIASFIDKNTLLVFNNTKVIQARLYFENSKQQTIEIFCLEPNANDVSMAMTARKTARWNCLVGNLKRWKEDELHIQKNNISLHAKIAERKTTHVVIDFFWTPEHISFAEVLEQFGNLPIPPYLNRESETIDTARYQTIYAKHEGSVAAPTAGLHFTDDVFNSLKEKSVETLSVTLHVGAGTFKPVKSETMSGHDMHAEWIDVDLETIKKLQQHEHNIIAVGTTSLRTIETLYWLGVKATLNKNATLEELEIKQWEVYDLPQQNLSAKESLQALIDWLEKNNLQKLLCRTQILIAPPYQLKLAHGIITNFHQPQSTLLLLISAVVGNKWREIYDYALSHNFRFLSYGDSSLLLK
ncbi:MAG: S-adenosylmethionine:tRNA ribosyltransferase-isomerase [Bacteroidetes bacterium]|nr:S-adenosylmethionine:tRNA ribosyltransferase-isomerase [Bacteroidota bacterium]